jgi:hypothetical protein
VELHEGPGARVVVSGRVQGDIVVNVVPVLGYAVVVVVVAAITEIAYGEPETA